jgi:hypothetical protein
MGEQNSEVATIRDAEKLYEALENLLGDLYLVGLAEITLEDVWVGSAHDAMNILKASQGYRKREQTLAIGQREVGRQIQ